MSNLSEAISEMRNMRESYDQIGAAAEAYNTGKTQLAQNITSKGVPASASETLPELAEKVSAIAQESYTIQGGEMYAKQLFGSLETPNYWNLYDVLTQLLSDGRLVNYGGILLAEYYRGYDSLVLSGAGAGGAYVVSDLDENGQFKMYTEDTTHVWTTEFDGKGNRWVAYCFADEYHDFQITDTNTSPRSIFIGRKVGTITSLVNGRISQIVVPDGNSLYSVNSVGCTQQLDKKLVLKNIEIIDRQLFYLPNFESIYLECESLSGQVLRTDSGVQITGIVKADTISIDSEVFSMFNTQAPMFFVEANVIRVLNYNRKLFNVCPKLLVLRCESADFSLAQNNASSAKIIFKYITNDKSKSVSIGSKGVPDNCEIELQEDWCKPIDVNYITSLTEANMYAHILQRLKQDEVDCGDGVTITLGATNLAKLTSEGSVQLLDDLTNIYGYTFA